MKHIHRKYRGDVLDIFQLPGQRQLKKENGVQSLGTHHYDSGEHGGRSRQMGMTLEQQPRILGLHGL